MREPAAAGSPTCSAEAALGQVPLGEAADGVERGLALTLLLRPPAGPSAASTPRGRSAIARRRATPRRPSWLRACASSGSVGHRVAGPIVTLPAALSRRSTSPKPRLSGHPETSDRQPPAALARDPCGGPVGEGMSYPGESWPLLTGVFTRQSVMASVLHLLCKQGVRGSSPLGSTDLSERAAGAS